MTKHFQKRERKRKVKENVNRAINEKRKRERKRKKREIEINTARKEDIEREWEINRQIGELRERETIADKYIDIYEQIEILREIMREERDIFMS